MNSPRLRQRPRTSLCTLVIALALAVAGCSQFQVRSGYDPGADLSRLHTWSWLPLDQAAPADQRVLDPYIDTRIRDAVAMELRTKGYAPAGSAAPDFLLNYRIATGPADVPNGDYERAWSGWAGAATIYRDSHDDGTLYLGIVAPASQRNIWRGAASARLLPFISVEERAQRVDDAVHQILARFPSH